MRSGLWRIGALLDDLEQLLDEQRNLIRDDAPKLLVVERHVAVDDSMPHVLDVHPRYLRVSRLRLGRYLGGCFPNHHDVVGNRVLDAFVLYELFAREASSPLESAARIRQHVAEIDRLNSLRHIRQRYPVRRTAKPNRALRSSSLLSVHRKSPIVPVPLRKTRTPAPSCPAATPPARRRRSDPDRSRRARSTRRTTAA